MNILDLFSKVRPQVFVAICFLGTIALVSVFLDVNEIAGVAAAGIIALAKDVIQSDV
tara:strand:- start:1555 stop:1725 length:171 start_codon:yes stop_codon:yes gene_type:complete